jgi:hypothetical protein
MALTELNVDPQSTAGHNSTKNAIGDGAFSIHWSEPKKWIFRCHAIWQKYIRKIILKI